MVNKEALFSDTTSDLQNDKPRQQNKSEPLNKAKLSSLLHRNIKIVYHICN